MTPNRSPYVAPTKPFMEEGFTEQVKKYHEAQETPFKPSTCEPVTGWPNEGEMPKGWPYDDNTWVAQDADKLCCTDTQPIDKVSPDHYKGKGMEVIDVIDAFDLDLYQGSVVQYVIRYKKKEGLTDLKKAKWYLDRMITKLEQGDAGRT